MGRDSSKSNREAQRRTQGARKLAPRVAQVQDVAKVPLEFGNSPRMVFSNYRELLRTAYAKWFAITPELVEAATAAPDTKPEGKIVVLIEVAA